jgi:hypothetical protein
MSGAVSDQAIPLGVWWVVVTVYGEGQNEYWGIFNLESFRKTGYYKICELISPFIIFI